MAKPNGPKRSRLSAEEQLLERQRNEIVRRQEELERRLKQLPVVLEAQEQQKRALTERRAKEAAPAISPYMGSSMRRRSRTTKGRSLRTPSRERFLVRSKTILLLFILAVIVWLLMRQIPSV